MILGSVYPTPGLHYQRYTTPWIPCLQDTLLLDILPPGYPTLPKNTYPQVPYPRILHSTPDTLSLGFPNPDTLPYQRYFTPDTIPWISLPYCQIYAISLDTLSSGYPTLLQLTDTLYLISYPLDSLLYPWIPYFIPLLLKYCNVIGSPAWCTGLYTTRGILMS